MPIGATASGDAVLGVEITVTNANEGAKLQLMRIDTSGYYPTVAVRGADMISPSSATMVFTDYEAPFNLAIEYEVSSYAISDLDTPINSDTVTGIDTTVPKGFAMITQVFTPTERVTGTVEKLPEWNREAKILSTSEVLGRADPVVVTDVFASRTGSFSISNIISHAVDYDNSGDTVPYHSYLGKWRTIFNNGATLLFRSDTFASGFDDLYFKAKSVGVEGGGSPVGYDYPDYPILKYTIAFQEQARPLTSTAGLGLTDWGDLLDSNVDWTEVMADHANWLSVLTDPTL